MIPIFFHYLYLYNKNSFKSSRSTYNLNEDIYDRQRYTRIVHSISYT